MAGSLTPQRLEFGGASPVCIFSTIRKDRVSFSRSRFCLCGAMWSSIINTGRLPCFIVLCPWYIRGSFPLVKTGLFFCKNEGPIGRFLASETEGLFNEQGSGLKKGKQLSLASSEEGRKGLSQAGRLI